MVLNFLPNIENKRCITLATLIEQKTKFGGFKEKSKENLMVRFEKFPIFKISNNSVS